MTEKMREGVCVCVKEMGGAEYGDRDLIKVLINMDEAPWVCSANSISGHGGLIESSRRKSLCLPA